jgi:hypothetical protein
MVLKRNVLSGGKMAVVFMKKPHCQVFNRFSIISKDPVPAENFNALLRKDLF